MIDDARLALAHYPQYAKAFDNVILVKINNNIETAGGMAFFAGQPAIAKPILKRYRGIDGKLSYSMTVWSPTKRLHVSLPIENITFLETDAPVEFEDMVN